MLLEAELGQRLSELEAKFGTAGVPSEARLQLYDDLFDAIIFKSKLYGPLLSLIKHEYHLSRRAAVASHSPSGMSHSHKAAAAAAAARGAALSPQGSGDFAVVAPGGKSATTRGGGDDGADARGGADGGGGGGGGGGGHHPAVHNDTARSVEAEVDRQRARWEAERQCERDESKRKEKEQSAQVRAVVLLCVCFCVSATAHSPWSVAQRAATEVEPGQSLELSHRPHTLVRHQRDGRARAKSAMC